LDHSVSVPPVNFRGLHCYVLIYFPAVTYFSSYQHVIKRLLYKWAACDAYIVNNINLDKMALRDTRAAVKSDTRSIQRIWVAYTADMVRDSKRVTDEVTHEWRNEVVRDLYSSPVIKFRYENWLPYAKT